MPTHHFVLQSVVRYSSLSGYMVCLFSHCEHGRVLRALQAVLLKMLQLFETVTVRSGARVIGKLILKLFLSEISSSFLVLFCGINRPT